MGNDFPVNARRRVRIPAAAVAAALARIPNPIGWVSVRLERACVRVVEAPHARVDRPNWPHPLRSIAAWLLEVPPSGRVAIEETLRAREARQALLLGHSVPPRKTASHPRDRYPTWAEIPAATIHPDVHRYGSDWLRRRATGAFRNGVPLVEAGEETKAVRAYLADTQSSFPSPYRLTRDEATK